MEKTLQVLNDLERAGIVSRYAIGGAMGATFYVEPVLTFDLDVFVVLPQTSGGLLTLSPLYEALRARGYREEKECVNIEGVPVQFLPAYNPLLEEALAEARGTQYDATPTRVLRAEHLLAIALQTGRDKDRERVRLLREQAALDQNYLAAILGRHGLAL
jgi:hypothetical protein